MVLMTFVVFGGVGIRKTLFVTSELGIKGMIIAVERKYYDKEKLDCIVEEWYQLNCT